MKRSRANTLIIVVIIFFVCVAWWWLYSSPSAVSRAYAKETNMEISRMRIESTNPSSEKLASLALQAKKIKQGSDAMVMEVKFYGKVIDQYGNPVPDMKVSYDAGNAPFTDGSGRGEVMTDADGIFMVTNAKANIFSIDKLEKETYEAHANVGFKGYDQGGRNGIGSWSDYTRENPYVFKVWKVDKYANVAALNNGDYSIYKFLPDGKSHVIDLLLPGNSGLDVGTGGHLVVLVEATDNEWKFRIAAVNGGIQEAADVYKNMAPEEGYQDHLEYGVKTTTINSPQNRVEKTYYFKSNGNYGVATLLIRPYHNDQASIRTDNYVINLEGGRELAVRPKE